jgi:hypothetical protein
LIKAGELSAMDINKLVDSPDFDACLSYLSLVSGMEGAALYHADGWVVGIGENTSESVTLEAPYYLSPFQETLGHFQRLGLPPLEHQVSFGGGKFYLIVNLGQTSQFFLVVTGTQGSYDLFKIRFNRGAQALVGLLRGRGYLRSQ